jgi:transposase
MPNDALPDDPETLKAMLLAERVQNERLRQIIKELQRHRFGRRAETLPEDQMLLGLEDVEQAEANRAAQTDVHRLRIERPGLTSAGSTGERCRGELHRIGEDRSERLDIVPAQFRVLVTRRPKYACRTCEDGVVQAPAPARLIEGGLPTEATVAQVGVQICRPSAAVSPSSDLRPPGHRSGSVDAGRLGRPCRLAPAPAA